MTPSPERAQSRIFQPDFWIASLALLTLLGIVLLQALLQGVVLFLVAGGGYISTVEGRQRAAIVASLLLLFAVPVGIFVVWACRETLFGRRHGHVAVAVLSVLGLVSGIARIEWSVAAQAVILLALVAARFLGYGPKPN